MSRAQAPPEATIRGLIEESIAAQEALLDPLYVLTIHAISRELVSSLRCGGKVIAFGNGGSAADATHLVAELLGRFRRERPSLPAIALDNVAAITAIGNDYAYEEIFARQVTSLGARGDVAIGISTSGRSANVLAGLRASRARGMVTVSLTGADGEAMERISDLCLRVPAHATARIQESHILVAHIICEIVEQELFFG